MRRSVEPVIYVHPNLAPVWEEHLHAQEQPSAALLAAIRRRIVPPTKEVYDSLMEFCETLQDKDDPETTVILYGAHELKCELDLYLWC